MIVASGLLLYYICKRWPDDKPSYTEISKHTAISAMWPQDVKDIFKLNPVEDCFDRAGQKDWVYIQHGKLRVRPEHADSVCQYQTIRLTDDYRVALDQKAHTFTDGEPLASDFMLINCTSPTRDAYSKVHSGIKRNEKYPVVSNTTRTLSQHNKLTNVLILGVDGTSKLNWMRNLPKTYSHVVNKMGGIILNKYNAVGDGTVKNLLPFLTGLEDIELPEARTSFPGAKQVDGFPWIWKEFMANGYVSQYSEDLAYYGTFQKRMMGFKHQPTDHYVRPYYLYLDKITPGEYCVGSLPRHKNYLNWMMDFYDVYYDRPKFSFSFHSQLTSESYVDLHKADGDYLQFLQDMQHSGHLDNTLVILMTDHGARYGKLRLTKHGGLEERQPFFAMIFPEWFREKHEQIIRNFKINANRLTTHFDAHATLRHILNFGNSQFVSHDRRGLSLFAEIPENRTCADAGVPFHYCTSWLMTEASVTDEDVVTAGRHILWAIQAQLNDHYDLCSKLTLTRITSAYRLADGATHRGKWYRVAIAVEPSGAMFEATLLCYSSKCEVSSDEISRLTTYGTQSLCIDNKFPHVRLFCYCKHQVVGYSYNTYLVKQSQV